MSENQNPVPTGSPASFMEPSTPDPNYVAMVMALIRAILQILSGFGFAWALTVNGSQVQLIASAIVMLATLIWSLVQKIQAAKRAHDVAVLSATAGKPVQPTATPA